MGNIPALVDPELHRGCGPRGFLLLRGDAETGSVDRLLPKENMSVGNCGLCQQQRCGAARWECESVEAAPGCESPARHRDAASISGGDEFSLAQ